MSTPGNYGILRSAILVAMGLMEAKIPIICFMNTSKKAELTTSIRHITKSAILFLLK